MLPPVRFARRQRTSIGQLIAGQETSELRTLPLEADVAGGLSDHKDTRELLQSHVLGPPRPWAPPQLPNEPKREDGPDHHLRASFLRPKWSHDLATAIGGPGEESLEHDAALARISARVAACERRMESKEARDAQMDEGAHRLAMELRQAKEAHAAYTRLADDRFAALETSSERAKHEDAATREQLHVLQNDFRDFAVTAVSRQRAEIEGEVTAAFARQNLSVEEWRATFKHRDAQLQGELRRLSASVEDVSGQLVTAQTELRTRLATLEASTLAGRSHHVAIPASILDNGVDAAVSPASGQALEYLRQQLEQLRQGSAQNGAGLTELWARVEGEAAARGTLQRDHEARFYSLDQVIRDERDNLGQLVVQRLEVLEARLGVERSEVAAKQAEIRDQLANGDHVGSLRLQDLAAKANADLEASERRVQVEISALRRHVDANIAQSKSARGAEEEARTSSLASLLRRVESSSEQQMQAATKMQQEVNASFKEIRDEVRAECAARVQAEQRLVADVSSASQTLASEVATVRRLLQQNSETVATELERLRQSGAERADRLSRYVDEKVAQAANLSKNDGSTKEIAEVAERVQALRVSLEEQARQVQQRLDTTAEDLRLCLNRSEDARVTQLASAVKDAERATSAAERRTMAAQEELQARFEAYVKHFDSTISSVQAAILQTRCRDQSDRAEKSYSKVLPATRFTMREFQRGAQAPQTQPLETSGAQPQSQQEELRTTVDGLRVHTLPDVASDVRKVLSRGEVVSVAYLLSTRDNNQWARLADSSGYVLSCSQSGAPLLESVQEGHVENVRQGAKLDAGPSLASSAQVRATDAIAERVVAACLDDNFGDATTAEVCSTPSDTSPRLLLSPEASVAMEKARRQQAAMSDAASLSDSL